MAKGEGTLKRLARLGSLTAKVGGSFVGQKLRAAVSSSEVAEAAREQLQKDNARRIVNTLGKMKGAAMKAGQALSMVASTVDLPDEVRDMLATLNDRAEPVPFATIQATVERELDGSLDTLFGSFDAEPLGTASLAQAHAATLPDGTPVVVKVLHEGVVESVQADLLMLRGLFESGRAFGRTREELDEVYGEVKARLLEELDYLQEAANLHQFHEVFGDRDWVRVPRNHPAWCTERVLTLDRMPGVPLARFLEEASPEVRQKAGENIARLFFEMAFHARLLHADPHPGNFLFEPDGRVGLLDFGCVKRLNTFWMGAYARAARSAIDDDREGLLEACRDLGAWVGEDPRAAQAIVDFCEAVVGPWRQGSYTIGSADDDLMERSAPVSQALWRYPEVRGPADIVFLHRTLGGLYLIGRQLQVRAPWGDWLREHCDHAIAVAEGRKAG